ncbi:hypothetical protein MRB53_037834 [Persea americana]|nr:hypothetical protein MRB53_037834 [Persea americana]
MHKDCPRMKKYSQTASTKSSDSLPRIQNMKLERKIQLCQRHDGQYRRLEEPVGIDVVSIDAIITDEENFVRIVYSNGILTDWDWIEDISDGSALAAKHVHTCKVATVGANIATVMASTTTKDNRTTSRVLMNGIEIYKCRHAIQDLQVHHSTDILIAFCKGFIIIGNKIDADKHVWTELPTPDAISFDVRYSTSNSITTTDLALASSTQCCQIFKRRQLSHLRRWRGATLVLWQLATGIKQFLPNLTANILRIVVNAAGDRYALCMADNSIMVLSTSERKPVANFSGLQLVERHVEDGILPCPAVSHPTRKTRS